MTRSQRRYLCLVALVITNAYASPAEVRRSGGGRAIDGALRDAVLTGRWTAVDRLAGKGADVSLTALLIVAVLLAASPFLWVVRLRMSDSECTLSAFVTSDFSWPWIRGSRTYDNDYGGHGALGYILHIGLLRYIEAEKLVARHQ